MGGQAAAGPGGHARAGRPERPLLASGMLVVTWNVLHRIHAVNWDEPAIRAWPDERARMASIAAHVAALGADVVCLQEVSGDQLAVLRDVVDGEILAAAHPRVPAYRQRFEAPVLRAPAEHLVVIVRGQGARQVAAATFAEDPGKGYLAVALADGTHVITTHVTHGAPHAAQCAVLAAQGAALAARAAGPAPVIVCGDFNADRIVCAARLGPALVAAAPPPASRPTRPRTAPSAKSQDIDHVFVRGAVPGEVAVLDGEGRSDHNPVGARVARG